MKPEKLKSFVLVSIGVNALAVAAVLLLGYRDVGIGLAGCLFALSLVNLLLTRGY